MSAEVIYQLTRYRRVEGTEEHVDQVRLLLEEGAPWLSYADRRDSPCGDEDPCAVIAAEPDLHGVRVDQVTRIQGHPQVIERLPLLLRAIAAPAAARGVPASATAPGDPGIQDAEQCDISEAEECELYVSDEWWVPLQTADGVRFFPSHGYVIDEPYFAPGWVLVRFIETASRTSGYFTGQLGLITAAVVADVYDPDEDDNVVTLSPRGDDAQTVVNWLLRGEFSSDFYGGDNDGHAMLTQLFVDAALHPDRYDRITGEDLAAGITQYSEGSGATPTAEWAMSLQLDGAVIRRALDLLSETDPQLADVVTAGVDPESLPGRVRAAALEEFAQSYAEDGGDE